MRPWTESFLDWFNPETVGTESTWTRVRGLNGVHLGSIQKGRDCVNRCCCCCCCCGAAEINACGRTPEAASLRIRFASNAAKKSTGRTARRHIETLSLSLSLSLSLTHTHTSKHTHTHTVAESRVGMDHAGPGVAHLRYYYIVKILLLYYKDIIKPGLPTCDIINIVIKPYHITHIIIKPGWPHLRYFKGVQRIRIVLVCDDANSCSEFFCVMTPTTAMALAAGHNCFCGRNGVHGLEPMDSAESIPDRLDSMNGVHGLSGVHLGSIQKGKDCVNGRRRRRRRRRRRCYRHYHEQYRNIHHLSPDC